MNLGDEVIFTITGVVLVFLILALLMFIIKIEGKLFDTINGKKSGSAQPKAAPVNRALAPTPAPAPARKAQAAPAVKVEQGVPGEVVAAIMAAICAMGGGKYTLKAVRRGRNNWGSAGINDATAPF